LTHLEAHSLTRHHLAFQVSYCTTTQSCFPGTQKDPPSPVTYKLDPASLVLPIEQVQCDADILLADREECGNGGHCNQPAMRKEEGLDLRSQTGCVLSGGGLHGFTQLAPLRQNVAQLQAEAPRYRSGSA
jgi:hypothetical protein